MQQYDLIRQKKRFEMLDKSSLKDVLKVNAFFGRYDMFFKEKTKKCYTYYDTENKDLYKSGIALYRTDKKKEHNLTMTLERLYSEDNRNLQAYRHKKDVLEIGQFDSIFNHADFLRNSFQNMFNSSLKFDADFLLKKLKQAYKISTLSKEYRLTSSSGLKCTFSFDFDTFVDNTSDTQDQGYYLTIYQHSKESTDEDFDNLISKLTRYCKSLTPIKESKIEIARKKTAQKKEYLSNLNATKMKNKILKQKKKK